MRMHLNYPPTMTLFPYKELGYDTTGHPNGCTA